MKRYRFTQTVKTQVPATGLDAAGREVPTVKGKLFQAGAEVKACDILPGCLESLIACRQVEEIEPVPPVPAAVDPPPAEPKPARSATPKPARSATP